MGAGSVRTILVWSLALLQICPVGAAQTRPLPQLTPAEQRVKDQVNGIAIGGKLTVRKVDGTEYHGRLQAVDPQVFSVREVDLKSIVSIAYADVDRVSKDYGGKGIGGRRVNAKRSRIIGIVLVAGLLTLVIAAVASDKS